MKSQDARALQTQYERERPRSPLTSNPRADGWNSGPGLLERQHNSDEAVQYMRPVVPV